MLVCNTPRPDICENIGVGLIDRIAEESGGKRDRSGVGGEGSMRRRGENEENFEGERAED